MKKLLFLLCFGVSISCYSQNGITDDGFVTSNLTVSTNQQLITGFMQEFNTGLENARSGTYASIESLIEQQGYDPRQHPTLEQWAQSEVCPVSNSFLQNILSITNSIGTGSTNIMQIRQELKNLAIAGGLSTPEASGLALFDIGLQSISQSFGLNSDPLALSDLGSQSLSYGLDLNSVPENFLLNFDQTRLPGWLRCVFGILGGGILGALQGASTGSTIPGLGTVVGGIIGFIGGGIFGAAGFC